MQISPVIGPDHTVRTAGHNLDVARPNALAIAMLIVESVARRRGWWWWLDKPIFEAPGFAVRHVPRGLVGSRPTR